MHYLILFIIVISINSCRNVEKTADNIFQDSLIIDPTIANSPQSKSQIILEEKVRNNETDTININKDKNPLLDYEVVHYDKLSTTSDFFESFVEGISVIPLKIPESVQMPQIPYFYYNNGEYYIVEKFTPERVLRFSGKGHFLNYIGNYGGGDDGYYSLNDLMFDNEIITVVSNNPTNKFVNYTKSGKYINTQKLNLQVQKAIKFNNRYLIYNTYGFSTNRLTVTDLKGETIKILLPVGPNIGGCQEIVPVFFRYGETILLREAYNHTVYQINGSSIKPRIFFDFDELAFPQEFYTINDNYKGGVLLYENGKILPIKYLENNNFIVSLFDYDKKGDLFSKVIYLRNKKTNSYIWLKYPINNPDELLFDNIITLTDNDEILLFLNHKKLLINRSLIEKHVETADFSNNSIVVIKLKI
jgi:hypothetical protein